MSQPDGLQDQPEKQRPAHLFKPGQSGNPKGRPKGTRDKLHRDFIRRLSEDFDRFGIYAIARTRHEDPAAYVRVCASLMPKEVTLTRPLDDFTDDELRAAVATLRAIQDASSAGSGAQDAGELQPAAVVSALSETT